MAKKRITDALVKATKPPATRQQSIIYDNTLAGFGVRVTRSGAKSFVINYVAPDGRERRYTIGSAEHWSSAAARQEAQRLKRLVDTGVDPLAEAKAVREAISVGDLFEQYLASARFLSRTPTSRRVDEGTFKRHLTPLLGTQKLADLTAKDVEKAQSDITAGKTAGDFKTGKHGLARVRGGPGIARKAMRLLSAALNWARDNGLTDTNPVERVKIGPDGKRDVVLSAKDYARMWKAIAALEEIGEIRTPAADAIRLIALTGARRGEVVNLKWSDVRLDHGALVIADHKTARSTGAPRIIGLSEIANRIVQRQSRGKENQFVFSSSSGPTTAITLASTWSKVCSLARLPDGAGLHALRHSLASLYAESGASAPEIAALLGHRNFSTSQIYVHASESTHARIASEAAGLILKNK